MPTVKHLQPSADGRVLLMYRHDPYSIDINASRTTSPHSHASSVTYSEHHRASTNVPSPVSEPAPRTTAQCPDNAELNAMFAACAAVESAATELYAAYEASYMTPHGLRPDADTGSVPCFVTPFYSSTLVPAPLNRFVYVLCRKTQYGVEGARFGLALMARYVRATRRPVTLLNMHRLLAVCMQVAMKAHSDIFVNNEGFAQAAGLELKEFNWLERHLLDAVGFNVQLKPAALAAVDVLFGDDGVSVAGSLFRGLEQVPYFRGSK